MPQLLHKLVLLQSHTFQQSRQSQKLTMGIAVTCVNAVIRLYVTPVAQPQESVPVAGMEGCRLVSLSVSSNSFCKIQWRCIFWPLSDLHENCLQHFGIRKGTLSDVYLE
jgi:hypothetical protein